MPTYLTFLFEDSDFFNQRGKHTARGGCYEEFGYSTSCGKSLKVLERFGYNLQFFAEVYDNFYEALNSRYIEAIKDQIAGSSQKPPGERALERQAEKHLGQYPRKGRLEELVDFVAFLRAAEKNDFSGRSFRSPYTHKTLDKSIRARDFLRFEDSLTDFEALQMYFIGKALVFPPSVVRVSLLFDEEYLYDYPEIVSLMFVRLVVEASGRNQRVVLDLSDICESAREAREARADLALGLVEKVNLYGKVFKVLTEQRPDLASQFAKVRVRSLLQELESSNNSTEKGKLLEEILSLIFESHPSFKVKDRRYNTGDEEIDLLVKNNSPEPFWIALQSPLLFVECKNWGQRVGAKEIRDFEVKLQNHRPLVSRGFIVSTNGFSRECFDEVKRISRDNYSLVLLDKGDLLEFANNQSLDLSSWLENRICAPL